MSTTTTRPAPRLSADVADAHAEILAAARRYGADTMRNCATALRELVAGGDVSVADILGMAAMFDRQADRIEDEVKP